MDFFLLFIGLGLVLLGAHFLTDGASEFARKYHISEFIVGVTIVGIGTSLPELVVSVASAVKGSGDMAVGNVVGSNIFNVFIILGITSLILPLDLTTNNIKKDIPFGVLASLTLLVCVSDRLMGDAPVDTVTRSEGFLLMSLFCVFMAYTIFSQPVAADTPDGEKKKSIRNAAVLWVLIVMGLAALVYGGDLFLDKALHISRAYGVSESVIGITLMAGGTALPELASCIIAAIKKRPQLALGNILGSNVCNVFLVLGASASINPLQPQGIRLSDLIMVIASSLLLFATAFVFKKRQISRVEGAIFIIIYIVYLVFLLKNS